MERFPKLPPAVAELANGFDTHANWGDLHALDWERFYELVILCAEEHSDVSCDEVKAHFTRLGRPENVTRKLAEAFDHGVAILQLVTKRRAERSSRQ